MPIYAYRCDACGAEKDVLQKISEAALRECPQCGAASFHRVLTAPAFQLKGSGWYVTDFRDGNKAKPATGVSAGNGHAAAPAEKSDAKSDPAAKGGDTKDAPASGASSSATTVPGSGTA